MSLYIVYKSILIGGLPLGILMAALSVLFYRKRKIVPAVILSMISLIPLYLGGLLNYDLHLTRNGSVVDSEIVLESWDAIADDLHNSNTDLIEFKGSLILIHQASPFHLGSEEAVLKVHKSDDRGRTWTQIGEVDGGDTDIRDPKFIIHDGKLQLYVLMNTAVNPEPYTTLKTVSDDGTNWGPLEEIGYPEWLYWRAKKGPDGYWYIPAYYYEHGSAILLKSRNGAKWNKIASIYMGGRNDETAIEFLPDGRMLATGRLEYSDSVFGHESGSTIITVSEPPYDKFNVAVEDPLTRLDGPRLFTYKNRILAVARYQPDTEGLGSKPGSAFTRKRTSLYEVTEKGLIHLTDLPSAGDTSYPGVVVQGKKALVSYYTSNIERDYMWVTGLFHKSPIRMAEIDLDAALKKSDENQRP